VALKLNGGHRFPSGPRLTIHSASRIKTRTPRRPSAVGFAYSFYRLRSFVQNRQNKARRQTIGGVAVRLSHAEWPSRLMCFQRLSQWLEPRYPDLPGPVAGMETIGLRCICRKTRRTEGPRGGGPAFSILPLVFLKGALQCDAPALAGGLVRQFLFQRRSGRSRAKASQSPFARTRSRRPLIGPPCGEALKYRLQIQISAHG